MPAESKLFLIEALDLISNTTIAGVLYGIAFTLYCLCAWPLYFNLQKPDEQRRARFTLACISLLFLCLTGILAFGGRIIQLAYINDANFPGGPPGYEQSYSSTTISYFAISGVLDLIIEALTMAIQIQRLWIIWSGTRYAVAVTILPTLLILSYIALVIPVDIAGAFVPYDQLGFSDRTATAMDTAIYAILSGLTILVTGLIAARLLWARRQHMRIMGMSEAASPYLSIVTMLVESYFLDSVWSLATAISAGVHSPSRILLGVNDSTIKTIAYFLIVYRVETGRGWTKRTQEKLSSLQWNHGQTATDEASGIQSRVPATTTMVGIDSLPIAHSDSAA